jgi:hypothetical protein
MEQPPDSFSSMPNLAGTRPCGGVVNEHSFILNHSPQDGKKIRRLAAEAHEAG